MRQNMEELQATQEEMQRGQQESDVMLKVINQSLSLVEFDPEGNVLKANSNFLDLFGYSLSEIAGEHDRIFVEDYLKIQAEITNRLQHSNFMGLPGGHDHATDTHRRHVTLVQGFHELGRWRRRQRLNLTLSRIVNKSAIFRHDALK